MEINFIFTNNTNETINNSLYKKTGPIHSKKELAEKLQTFYEDKKYRAREFKVEAKTGKRKPETLQKYAEIKHVHDKYFQCMRNVAAMQQQGPALAADGVSAGHFIFFEAAFKLGRITDDDNNFAKACEQYAPYADHIYFPFRNIQHE